ALADAVAWGKENGAIPAKSTVLTDSVAAVSVGIIRGVPMVDLPYEEDVRADTDMNIVMTGSGGFVEVQGTAEGVPFARAELDALLTLAADSITDVTAQQRRDRAKPLTPTETPGSIA